MKADLSSRLEVVCDSAQEFIARLRLSDQLWRGRPSNKWAFRGQADAGWGLIPKAFRSSTNLAYTGSPVRPPLGPERQRREELRALNHFLFLADRVGLPVPGDGQHLRLPDTVQHTPPSFRDWPWPTVLETLAIAQHHGVPTRLLDFSHDPLTAAFFAAHGAWSSSSSPDVPSGRIAVWAINLEVVSACVEAHRQRRERPSIIWVTASRASNTFLHQQDALFLLDLDADSRPFPPDLERAVIAAPERAGLQAPAEPLVVQLVLAASQISEVLRLLWNEAYYPAKLMPTYDNVALTLEYRRALGV
jgi:hypothetical protein